MWGSRELFCWSSIPMLKQRKLGYGALLRYPGMSRALVLARSGEGLGTLGLIGVRLWVPEGQAKQTTRVAIKGYTDKQSNESLLKKFMTSKFPSTLRLMELAEELTAKRCELKLQWLRRDDNQLADDLTNEKFDSFDKEFKVPLKGADIQWRILDNLTRSAESLYQELS